MKWGPPSLYLEMVSPKGKGRWLRKYKIFLLIGIVILLFQVFLAARFLDLIKSQNDWQIQSKKVAQTGENSLKRLISPTNTTTLHLEQLDFKPGCEIVGKEAVSAIHRAKSKKCKQFIANVTCQSLAGTLYPKILPTKCPKGDKVPGKSLGCFKDEDSFRLLSGYFGTNKKNNSPDYCINLCLQSGFMFAGVQYS